VLLFHSRSAFEASICTQSNELVARKIDCTHEQLNILAFTRKHK
jgi:hypothetical protein